MSDISKVKVFENRFPVAKKVIWDDAVKKVNLDVDNDAFYALKEETDVKEGNAFGDAVRKAKELIQAKRQLAKA